MKNKIYKGSEKVIFGVCSGLAEYFETDPLLFRLLFLAVFALPAFNLSIIIIYLISAFLMPSKNES